MQLIPEIIGLGIVAVIGSVVVMITLAVLKWFFNTESPFADIARRNYKAEINHGRITSKTKSSDFLTRINDERRALDGILNAGKLEPTDIGPQLWTDSREHMAGIILAVINMAQYYNIDILDEMKLNALQNEADARS